MEKFMLILIGFWLNWRLGLALIGLTIIDYQISVAMFKRMLRDSQSRKETQNDKSSSSK